METRRVKLNSALLESVIRIDRDLFMDLNLKSYFQSIFFKICDRANSV